MPRNFYIKTRKKLKIDMRIYIQVKKPNQNQQINWLLDFKISII